MVTFYVCMEMQNTEHDCHNFEILLKTHPLGHVAKIFLQKMLITGPGDLVE